MSDPAPRQPNKLTYNESTDGRVRDYDVDIIEADPIAPPWLQERRARKKREREERARAGEEPTPPTDDRPAP